MNKGQRRRLTLCLDVLKPYTDNDLMKAHDLIETLRKYEIQLSTINTRECNTGLTPQDEKKREKIQELVHAVCYNHNIKVKFGNDPTGYAIKLKLPSKRHNSWDGESWCIEVC